MCWVIPTKAHCNTWQGYTAVLLCIMITRLIKRASEQLILLWDERIAPQP